MRRTEREGIASKILTCSVLCAGVAAFALAADPRPEPGGQAWSESAYRNFLAPQAILGGRFVVSDEARDPGLTAALAPDLRAREEALLAAAAPGIDLPSQSAALGRFYVDEFARAAGGSAALRAVWEKAAESGQEVLPLFLKAYSDSAGEPGDGLLLRFAARLYA